MIPRPHAPARAAADLPGAICARHPGLPADAWLPADKRDPRIPQAIRSCLVLCPALDQCRMWADMNRPTAGVYAGELRGV